VEWLKVAQNVTASERYDWEMSQGTLRHNDFMKGSWKITDKIPPTMRNLPHHATMVLPHPHAATPFEI
jgi:hypothetical protein